MYETFTVYVEQVLNYYLGIIQIKFVKVHSFIIHFLSTFPGVGGCSGKRLQMSIQFLYLQPYISAAPKLTVRYNLSSGSHHTPAVPLITNVKAHDHRTSPNPHITADLQESF